MKITFLGASKTVTGSCYLVESQGIKFLIDCGMFQGPDVEHLNKESFKFDPKEIDFVILTHSHLDHCGLLPKLTKDGFTGNIYCTNYTRKITESILLDSAKLQEKNYDLEANFQTLYSTNDAFGTINRLFTQPIDKELQHEHLKFIFRKASHILGAISVEIYAENTAITFSGDLGRRNDRLIDTYNDNYNTTPYVVTESLYGDTDHENMDVSLKNLSNIVNNTFKRNGIVMIPVFAIHRSLLMIDVLEELIVQNQLPKDTKIILDSPLAARVAEVYKEHNSRLNLSNFPHLVYKKQHIKKFNKGKNTVILAGGGMANGGKILGYFKRYISNRDNSVIFVGFQAEETLGRKIVEGEKSIEIDQKAITVAAEIHNLNGFSAHADQSELLWWFSRFNKDMVKKVFLVHAEEPKSQAFKAKLLEQYPNLQIEIPGIGYSEELQQ